MPFPLIPIVIAAVAGIGIEKGFKSLFGDDGGDVGIKKSGIGNVFHEPYEQYAPTHVDMRQVQLPDYQVQIDSPFARQDLTKKQVQEPDISGGATATTGINPTHIALVGVGVLVLYGVTKK